MKFAIVPVALTRLAHLFGFTLISMALLTLSVSAQAQNFGSRTATVAVAEAGEDRLSIFTDIQGRVAAGQVTAITASANAVTVLEPLRIGDMLKAGQLVAKQDDADFRDKLDLLKAQRTEAALRLTEVEQTITADQKVLELQRAQLVLLQGKAERAQTLVSRNALAVDAAETAQTAVITTQQQIAQRESALTGREYQRQLASASIARLDIEIRQVKAEIKAARITAPVDGQIVFLHPARRGFLREGDVLIRTRAPDDYEVEAEVPLEYLNLVEQSKTIMATDFTGLSVALSARVILPVQNIRTGTQTIRFAVDGTLPGSLLAENAPVTLKIPTTSPAPVVTVPKDAVIPISGGHIVFIAADGVALQRRVKLGNAVGEAFIVLDGLQAGEQVVTRGNEGLVDGRKIKIGDPGKRARGPKGEKWTLNWTTRRGPASGDLVLGPEKSFFNDEPVEVTRVGDDINFIGKLVLPFGVLDLEFIGTVTGADMSGTVTIRGLPGGRESTLDFTGTRDAG
ncbi:MAG: efflux RND transporter periplasmic adaptor subunit [Candidatus Puniceispirillaceae bacterium]